MEYSFRVIPTVEEKQPNEANDNKNLNRTVCDLLLKADEGLKRRQDNGCKLVK
jgi:hypothetical protein